MKLVMKNFKFSIVIYMFLFSFWDISAQDEDVYYNDTLTKKFFQIKKDFSKKTFESTYYTIQIFYGSLNEADSIYNDFKENNVVNLPDSPITEITFLSFLSGCPNKLKANLILLRPKLTDLLNSL